MTRRPAPAGTGMLARRSVRRTDRGVGMLFFALVGVPVLFFAVTLAADFTRIIVTHRQMSLAGDAGAIAGAFEFVEGEARLDIGRAEDAARETFDRNITDGAVDFLESYDADVRATLTQVTVDVEYRVDGLLFMRWFTDDEGTFTVSRAADVCVPGVHAPTSGFCARPDAG